MTAFTCRAMDDAVEALAAGDAAADEAATHLASCASCQARLALARRVERVLREWPSAPPPATFAQRVIDTTRREAWRREQVVDWSFNAAIGAGLAAVAVGALALVWMIVSITGGVDAGGITDGVTALVLDRVRPQLAVTATASLLVTTALGAWWWAEGRMRL